MNKVPILKSSANPNNVSLTLKGLILALIPATTVLLSSLGADVTQDTLTRVVEAVWAIVAGSVIVYGFGRKVYYAFR